MAKRKGFFNHVARPEDAEARMRDIEALFVPRRSALQDVPLDRIHPNPFQARQTFDAIDELAEAIRVQGFVSRLRLRPHPGLPGHFQLVYGERRLRAAQAAGMAEVPCEISDHNDAEMVEIGLTENIQRRDLDPLEEAHALQAIIEAHGYTISALAERLGKSKGYVNNRLALLRAPEDVQLLVAQRPHTILAARDLAALPAPEDRKELIDGLVAGRLTATDVRAAVRSAQPAAPDVGDQLGRDYAAIRAILGRWQSRAGDLRYREGLLFHVEQLIADVEELAEALQD
jgi:ParB family transcriptional regulator, chromosome partitioning protein